MITLMGYWLTLTDAFGTVPGPQGVSHPNRAPYDVYETSDGEYLFIAPASEGHWESFCEAIEADELLNVPEFETIEDRRENVDELDEQLSKRIVDYTQETLLERLRDIGVPAAPVNNTVDVLNDEHLEATGFFDEVDWPTDGSGPDNDAVIKIPGPPSLPQHLSPTHPRAPQNWVPTRQQSLRNSATAKRRLTHWSNGGLSDDTISPR